MGRKMLSILLTSIMVLALVAACSSEEPEAEPAVPGRTEGAGEPMPAPAGPADAIDTDPPEPEPDTWNKIQNGDFSNGTSGWGLYLEGGSADLETADITGCGTVKIRSVGRVSWGVQMFQDGISLTLGNVYRLSFNAASDVPRDALVRIQLNASPYTAYMEEPLHLGPAMSSYDFEFTMNGNSDPAGRLVLNLGTVDEEGTKPEPEAHNVTVGNFELTLVEGNEGTFVFEDFLDIPLIRVNQVGYSPDGAKKAVLLTDDASFEVCYAATGEVAYTGTASGFIESPAADEKVRIADFSALSDTGKFIVRNRDGESYPFYIREDPYAELKQAVLDFYEYQKCGIATDLGVWSYDACHTTPAAIWGTDGKREVTGGWHDAGDYGRYIVPSAKTVTDLLLAYELTDAAHPDILDIVRYQLEWMLKMQDPATGGVYHKVTTESFCGVIWPHEDTDPLYLSPISPTATGGFAASLAFASRVYRDTDPAFAGKMLAAAEKAWQWLDKNQMYPAFKNPEGIITGEYGDLTSLDERLWAACELYSATGKSVYHGYISGVRLNERVTSGLGWDNTGSYALIAYLLMPEPDTDPAVRTAMQRALSDNCENLMAAYNEEPYALSLGMDYPWGSNMTVGNNAVLLMFANKLKPNAAYTEAAADHLHYLLGRNALSQSYVTGFGTQPTMHPHHRPSEVARMPVPGMVAGGPNGNLEDPFVATWLQGLPPMKCYADTDQSYSTNEVTIYWNSPVYLLLALLEG